MILDSDAVFESFNFAGIPKIIFGAGVFGGAAEIIKDFGKTALLVTGDSSFRSSKEWDEFLESLLRNSMKHFQVAVRGEPSPDLVDAAVAEFGGRNVDVVMAFGGGSVVDAGKAIAAMLPSGDSVIDYLEGVGTGAKHGGEKAPFVAVPTTAGTGSEATKNAVLSRVGADGFKKSLRHDNFVPDVAIVDPQLAISCPPDVTAACGLDAFTQLLESYVSTNASPMTDALALSGIECVGTCLVPASTTGAADADMRAGMSYGALISGITLANAGLGVVHGFASPIGGRFDIPHGVVCGTLIGAATEMTIKRLMERHGPEHPALRKYARAGSLLCGVIEPGVQTGCRTLVEEINKWVENLKIPRLSAYGITQEDLADIAARTGNKNNPAVLDKDDMQKILRKRM